MRDFAPSNPALWETAIIPKRETPGFDIRKFRFFASIKPQSARRQSFVLCAWLEEKRQNLCSFSRKICIKLVWGVGAVRGLASADFFRCWRVLLPTKNRADRHYEAQNDHHDFPGMSDSPSDRHSGSAEDHRGLHDRDIPAAPRRRV